MARGVLRVRITGDERDLTNSLKRAHAEVGKFGSGISSKLGTGVTGTFKRAAAEVERLGGSFGGAGTKLGAFAGKADNALKSLGTKGTFAQSALGNLGLTAGNTGKLLSEGLTAGTAVAGAALAGFALKGVHDFVNLADEVRKFKEISGASAETSSRFVSVMNQLGIDTNTGAKAFFLFGKAIAGHEATLNKLGIQVVRNKDGNADLTQSLFAVSDAFLATQDPAKRAQIAAAAFGRGGAALIPILERGKIGLQEFFAEADKSHQILSDRDLQKALNYKIAVERMHEAFSGVSREVGSALVPALAAGADILADLVHKGEQLAHVLGPILAPIAKLASLAFPSETSLTPEGIANAAKGFGLSTTAINQYTAAVAQNSATTSGASDSINEFSTDVTGVGTSAATTTTVLSKQGEAIAFLQRHYRIATDAVDHFGSTLKITLGGVLDVQEATSRYNEDLAALGVSLRQNGRSFDLNTEKGRSNSQALRTLVGDIEDQISAEVRSGKISADDATQKSELLKALRALEKRYPALKGQLETYIGAVKRVPVEHVTKIGLRTPSKAQVEKAAATLINHFDTKFDKEGGIPVKVTPKFTTPSLTVTATNVFLSGGTRSAEGRIVTSPIVSLIGEAGPEAVIPLGADKQRRRWELLQESGLMKEVLARVGVKQLAAGAIVAPRIPSPTAIPSSLIANLSRAQAQTRRVASDRAAEYTDNYNITVINPAPEKLTETLPAVRRRIQLTRGH